MPAAVATPLEDRRLRDQLAQERFDFAVPMKTWFTLPEVAEVIGMKETFVRELIDNGGLDAHAHNSRIIDSKEDFRRHHRIHRSAVTAYLLRTRTTEPADEIARHLSYLDTLGPLALSLVAERVARRRQKLANG
jgi:hypothetical protein